jgi:hypothetical protein
MEAIARVSPLASHPISKPIMAQSRPYFIMELKSKEKNGFLQFVQAI